MSDTHAQDKAIYQVTETRTDCDGSCATPEGPRPTNLEWSGLPPAIVSLVERAFREGIVPEEVSGVRREVRIGLGPIQVRVRRR